MATVFETMTTLANGCRALSSTTVPKGLNNMISDINAANDEILIQVDLLEQIITALESKFPEAEKLEGDGQEFYTMAPSTLTFRSSAPLNEFKEVQINGQTVDPSNYTLEEGSTIVTFSIDYLKTFGKGNYEVTVKSESKTVKGEFTVVDPDLNEYGFYYNQPYVTEVELPIEAGATSKAAFFLRENGAVDVIYIKYGLTMSGTFTCEGKNATMYLGNMVLTSVWSDDGKSIYNNEMQITAVLGSAELAADSDFMYVYDATLEGYKVTPINKTKSYYGLIKSNINDIPTVAISDRAFHECDSLVKITIPDTVTTIGEYAFWQCYSLKECVIGNSVKNIGNCAFSQSGLTSITIPASVTSIGEQAFDSCYTLVEVINKSPLNIVAGLQDNGSVARYAKEVHGGKSKIVDKNNYQFYTHSGVNYLVGYTGDNTELTLPESYNGKNYEIYKYMFHYCPNIVSIVIHDGVTSIGDCAFYGCDNLTNLTIGNSVTSIGSAAFYFCDRLTNVKLPDSLTNISGNAFGGCDNLAYNEYNNAYYLGNSLNPYLVLKQAKDTSITSCEINSGTRFILERAFYDCSNLTSIIIPNSVMSISEDVFVGCDSLSYNEYNNVYYLGNSLNPYLVLKQAKESSITSCEIKSETRFILGKAFYGCSSLMSIVIHNGVMSIGEHAFDYCRNLTSIVIPDSVTSIGDEAFGSCNSLTSIKVGYANSNYKHINDNLYTKDGKTFLQYALGKTDMSFTLPDGVTSIGNFALSGCCNLTSIVIPDGVENIGREALSYCNSLTSIVIPDSVTSIGQSAFNHCGELTSILFEGTIANWNAISKGWGWNTNVPATYIQCSDGQVAI